MLTFHRAVLRPAIPVLAALLTLWPTRAHAADRPYFIQKIPRKHFSIGVGAGINAPYSTGIELSIFPFHFITVNTGLGRATSGVQTGVGLTGYVFPKSRISYFASADYVISFGTDRTKVEGENLEAFYGYESDTMWLLSAGARFRSDPNLALALRVGWAFANKNPSPTYLSGSRTPVIETNALRGRPGGFALSISIQFLLEWRVEHKKSI